MITVEKLLFPGIGLGCLFLVLATSIIARPNIVMASNIVENKSQTAAQGLFIAVVNAGSPENQTPQNQPGSGDASQTAGQQSESAPEELAAPAVEQAGADSVVEEAAYAESEDCSLGGGFPDSVRQWCELIDRYATDHGLDPNLVAAVMVQESGGNPQAYSKDGAVGLLQVMPRDGKAAVFQCINGPCFADRPTIDELMDPEFNVSYGSKMLAGLIQKKGGVREALRAYGPMNMGYYYADLVLGIMNRFRQ